MLLTSIEVHAIRLKISASLHYLFLQDLIFHLDTFLFDFHTTLIRNSPLHPPPHYPLPQPLPYLLLLKRPHSRRQSTRSGSHKHSRTFPLSLHSPHVLLLILPPIPKLALRDLPPMLDPPNGLPDPLPHNTHALRSPPPRFLLQHFHPLIHLLRTQFRGIFRRSGNNVRVSQGVEVRQVLILLRFAKSRSASAAVG